MSEEEERICLENYEAVKLWRLGKEAWNEWVKQNPVADIDFSGVDFSKLRSGENSEISFPQFNFPTGIVNFYRATFGDGDVYFTGATFGDGDVYFTGATFGDGAVNFRRATFGDGIVIFEGVTFGNGKVNFEGATFGDGEVDFWRATFGDGDVYFEGATFGDGDVIFRETTFGNGDINFPNATFGDGGMGFISAKFTGKFYLKDCKNTEKLQSFTFQNSTFKDAVVIKNISLSCVLDMVNTSLTNQISLHGLTCHLQRNRNKWGAKVVKDTEDIERLTRLKELAESNKNHEQSLAFHADEQRAKRWIKTGILASIMDMMFSGLSDYGQSIMRPMLSWLLSILIFTVPYVALSENSAFTLKSAWELLVFSAFNSVPFLTMARSVRADGIEVFFKDETMLSIVDRPR